ncbi:hypothetical protein M501DRAFT_990324 [Patellaria atrata CBS 101060]|uniref:Uncharacterized protein n=1 Tax=Patellaria atrata CBS 101060 TaxID=1346257 RepID=A0A9P4S3F1_9PEZI|nr:hypothetical protein M501DRAFT_990324 [Patellaria atrata CBS 101060]
MPKSMPDNVAEMTVIRQVTPNITIFSAPFFRNGLLKVGGRGTLGTYPKCPQYPHSRCRTNNTLQIVRLPSGGVAVFSPISLTPAVKEAAKALGEVKYITASDIEHHMSLGDWHDAFPQAKLIGPEGLPEKRAKQNMAIPFSIIIDKNTKGVDPEFDAVFDFEYVQAHQNKEIVFNYKPDRTLIQADLIFNLPANEQFSKSGTSPEAGLLTKLWIHVTNTRGRALGQQRLIWYAISRSDREGFGRSMKKINTWDFDRVIPCHGDVIESGGKGIFQKIMTWHLEPKEST